MNETSNTRWLDWSREIQSISQIGITFAENDYQLERYQRLMEIAAEIVNENTELPVETILEVFRIQPGYSTPKIDVRGAIFKDLKLLMVREKMDGRWSLPGGWAEVGEAPAESVEREVLEESGFRVKVKKVIGVYDANRWEPMEFFHAYKLVFLCDIIGGKAATSKETTAVTFFSEDEFPLEFAGERTRMRHIYDAFSAVKDENFTTVFD